MKKQLMIILLGFLLVSSCNNNKKKGIDNLKTGVKNTFIEIMDEEALKLVDSNATIQTLAKGFVWTEGPLWIENGNYLLFSDIPENKVYKLNSNNDTITYLYPSGYTGVGEYSDEPGSNGLFLNNDGQLVLCQHGDRKIVTMDAPLDSPKPNYTTVIDNFQGKKFNSPNDGVYDKNGNLYFTDPPYGLAQGMDDPTKELEFQGVYCLLISGEVILLDKLSRPNGIALSPDESTLYVSNSNPEHAVWYKYHVKEPGSISDKEIFYDATYLVGKEGEKGLPDGMEMNSKGYLFASGPGGIWIFNKFAKPIAKIRTGQNNSNCTFTTDEKKLFICADDYIMSIDLK